MRPRVIPCLLLKGRGLVKTERFRKPTYIGDPVNTVRIFNEKEVDEIAMLDIDATIEDRAPQFELIEQVAGEAFMPLAYGGGIRRLDQARRIIGLGVEKVVLNSVAFDDPGEVRRMAGAIGSQSIVVSVDAKKSLFGRWEVRTRGGRKRTGREPVAYCAEMQALGAGEILLNSIDREGTMQGYDLDLIRAVCREVDIPVIACGGAGRLEDFSRALRDGGAAAVAAGSLFVFQGRHRAVLISYPTARELAAL